MRGQDRWGGGWKIAWQRSVKRFLCGGLGIYIYSSNWRHLRQDQNIRKLAKDDLIDCFVFIQDLEAQVRSMVQGGGGAFTIGIGPSYLHLSVSIYLYFHPPTSPLSKHYYRWQCLALYQLRGHNIHCLIGCHKGIQEILTPPIHLTLNTQPLLLPFFPSYSFSYQYYHQANVYHVILTTQEILHCK